MKKIIVFCTLLVCGILYSQDYRATFGNSTLSNRSEWWTPNSPTNMDGNRTVLAFIKGFLEWEFRQQTIRFSEFSGVVPRFATFNNNGELGSVPMSEFYLSSNPNNFLSKTASDLLYEPLFSKNTAFNKGFGTGSGQVMEGNDSRMVNAVQNSRTINGYPLTSNVSLTKSDIGLANANNTSDADKPLSNAVILALAEKLSLEVDGSTTNELQTISKVGDVLTISNGNSIQLNIPASQIQSDWNQTNNSASDFIKNKPIKVFNNSAVKTINGSGVQISTNRDAYVSYSVTHNIALTLVLSSGSSQVFLEISPNNSTWTAISQAGYSDGVAVAVALNKSTTNNVQGLVPSGYYVRLRSVTSGAGSNVFSNGQETLN